MYNGRGTSEQLLSQVLKQVDSLVSTSSDVHIERRSILHGLENQFRHSEIIDALDALDSAVIKRNPIVYDGDNMRAKLKSIVNQKIKMEPVRTMTTEQRHPTKQEEEINAANDPGLRKMIKTQSYTELEEWMNPENPINIYIAGETGLGKSSAVLHIRKCQGHPVVRVNLSYFTDIDDLIGGLRLENDATTFQSGPVIMAMQMPNCTLLLDEVDQANPRVLMDIQPVLEGKGYLIKKTGQMVYPAKGFNVVATGNSKGTGDTSGEYIGVNPLNKAFLDRFHITVEFTAPSKSEMRQILRSDCRGLSDEMVDALASWYNQIQDAKKNGVTVETLSTRRMVNIGWLMLNRKVDVVDAAITEKCLNAGIKKYDEEVRGAFMNIWDIVAKDAIKNRIKRAQVQPDKVVADPTTGFVRDEEGDIVPF